LFTRLKKTKKNHDKIFVCVILFFKFKKYINNLRRPAEEEISEKKKKYEDTEIYMTITKQNKPHIMLTEKKINVEKQ